MPLATDGNAGLRTPWVLLRLLQEATARIYKNLLHEEYCSGYIDTFGKWSTGFPCPTLDTEEPVYCCGTNNFKYCCTKQDRENLTKDIPQLTLVLGVVFGMAVSAIVVVVVSCFQCSCCLLYKKRQPTNGGPLYQMHSSTTPASGVANMYSLSTHSLPRSQVTVESNGSTNSNQFDHRDLIDTQEPLPLSHAFNVDRRILGPRPASLNMSTRSSTVSEGPTEHPHPPSYTATYSNLVAICPSSAYALPPNSSPSSPTPCLSSPNPCPSSPTPRPPSPTYGQHHSPYFSGGDSGYSSASVDRPMAALPPLPPQLRLPSLLSQTFSPALVPDLTPAHIPTTRPFCTGQIIDTHHTGPDENIYSLYTATKF